MQVRGLALAFCMFVGTAAATLPGAGMAATSDRRGATSAKAPTSANGPQKATRVAAAPAAGQARATKVRHAASAAGRGGQSRHVHRAVYGGGISCVPYARMVTGMQVSGNGGHWWHNAAGLYARGQRPEPGSVMAFRPSGGMSRGHVAVVSRVVGPRHVLIDHANWSGPGVRRGTVMRNVNVIDVSDRNDWSAVRVQVGHDSGSFGRTYPTYGFIYNRPDTPTYFAGGPTRVLHTTPDWQEVAEASVGTAGAATTPQRRRR